MAPLPVAGRILFIDAYDSFSENIAALLSQFLHVQVTMIHIDTEVEQLLDSSVVLEKKGFGRFVQDFDAVVLGPGPGDPRNPTDVGLYSEIWKLSQYHLVPVLGICLGFQSLCVAFGGTVSRLPKPCHGHAKKIHHRNDDIFAGVGEVIATNYHSLEARLGDSLPSWRTTSMDPYPPSFTSKKCFSSHNIQQHSPKVGLASTSTNLEPLAWCASGTLMGVRHVSLPYWGLQFHPESCKSNTSCKRIIENWWNASRRWTAYNKPVLAVPRSSLHPGHIWSRPLTPIEIKTETYDISGSHEAGPTLQGTLHTLTASCAQSAVSQKLKLLDSSSRVGELCRTTSQQDMVMLESVRKGRYSIYAFPGTVDWRIEYMLHTSTCTVYQSDQMRLQWKSKLSHVLNYVYELVAHRKVNKGHESLPFWGGFIGFISYETGLESLGVVRGQQTEPGGPDISLRWVERSIVIDHMLDEVHVQSIRKDDSKWITTMVERLGMLACPPDSAKLHSAKLQKLLASTVITLPNEETYKQRIRTCKTYLHAGDSYELCLTTEAQVTLPSHSSNSWLLYKNLCRNNPVPFSAFLRLGSTTILSSSPEQFISWSRSTGTINMVPMKGTVAKSPCMTLDRAKSILASPKESAENLMIADLIRHDLYSTVGWNASVEVVKLCEVIEHETVYQLVSHIRATPPLPDTLSDDQRQQEIIRYGHKALRQTLPPGSMTGAPKKRSCEILRRLENRRRGVYSGVIGYLDVGGGGDFSVCIRTAVSTAEEDESPDGRQTWRVGAGGAITVLSDVDAEWEEMKTKLDSVLRAFRPG